MQQWSWKSLIQIILDTSWSATVNKLSFTLQLHIYNFCSDFLIKKKKQMESLEVLLLDVETHSENKITSTDQETKKPTTKRWYKVIRDIPSSSLIPCLKKTSSTKKTWFVKFSSVHHMKRNGLLHVTRHVNSPNPKSIWIQTSKLFCFFQFCKIILWLHLK